jgi:DNA-directed RNA polymerase subunit RPC12/RpoP
MVTFVVSDTCYCGRCNMGFGPVVKDNSITCPRCQAKQILPVVRLSVENYRCADCKINFGISGAVADVICPKCKKAPEVVV